MIDCVSKLIKMYFIKVLNALLRENKLKTVKSFDTKTDVNIPMNSPQKMMFISTEYKHICLFCDVKDASVINIKGQHDFYNNNSISKFSLRFEV